MGEAKGADCRVRAFLLRDIRREYTKTKGFRQFGREFIGGNRYEPDHG
jgi:hypothetical protein